jgi:hypothetical protein
MTAMRSDETQTMTHAVLVDPLAAAATKEEQAANASTTSSADTALLLEEQKKLLLQQQQQILQLQSMLPQLTQTPAASNKYQPFVAQAAAFDKASFDPRMLEARLPPPPPPPPPPLNKYTFIGPKKQIPFLTLGLQRGIWRRH